MCTDIRCKRKQMVNHILENGNTRIISYTGEFTYNENYHHTGYIHFIRVFVIGQLHQRKAEEARKEIEKAVTIFLLQHIPENCFFRKNFRAYKCSTPRLLVKPSCYNSGSQMGVRKTHACKIGVCEYSVEYEHSNQMEYIAGCAEAKHS